MTWNSTIVEGCNDCKQPLDKPFAVNCYESGGYGYPHSLDVNPGEHAGIFADQLLYRIRVYPKRTVFQ